MNAPARSLTYTHQHHGRKAEAQYVKDQVLAEGEAQLAQGKAAETGDPARAMEIYNAISIGLGKTDPGKKADARIKELGPLVSRTAAEMSRITA